MSVSKDSPKSPVAAKRKREDRTDKPAKRPHTDSTRKPTKENHDPAIAMMDASLLSDHFAKVIKRHAGNKTSLELEEKFIPSKTFKTTTDFQLPHTASNLPVFLEQFTKGGKEELSQCKDLSCPHTLIIASSGIRTADLVRTVRIFNTEESKVAKLFAKHMKLNDNIQYVKKTKIGIAVGTPTRLLDLFKADALKSTNLKRIVIDGSYRDEKKRTIFDMPEIANPLLDLLATPQLQQALATEEGNTHIYVF